MPNNELEKSLRDRLHGYESSVDAEATWLAVEERLRKKKRRGFAYWWLAGVLLLLLGGGAYAWANWQTTKLTENAFPLPHEQAVQTAQQARTQDAKRVKKTTPPASLPDDQLPATSSSRKSPESVQGPGINTSVRKAELPPEGNAENMALIPVSTPAAAPPATAESNQTRINVPSPAPYLTRSIDPLPDRFYDPATPPFSELKGPKDCPVFVRRKTAGFELSLNGAHQQFSRNIELLNPEMADQRIRNLTTERPLEAITTEALLGYRTRNNFTLRSGLSLTRINSVATFRRDTTVESTVEGITEIIINPGGDTTFIFGEVRGVTRTSQYNEYYNRLTTLDLPILIGKTFRRGRWSLGLEAGPVINIRSRGSARYQLSDLSFSERDAAAFSFRPRLIGLGWQGNLSMGYRLLPKLDLKLGLRAHRFPGAGVEAENVGLATRYTIYGGQLGVSWRW